MVFVFSYLGSAQSGRDTRGCETRMLVSSGLPWGRLVSSLKFRAGGRRGDGRGDGRVDALTLGEDKDTRFIPNTESSP